MIADTYRKWLFDCLDCGKQPLWTWQSKLTSNCPQCGKPAELYFEARNRAPGVIGDDIPGGMMVEHGICYPDGTPRRVDSKTELKRHLNEAGLTIKGDSCKPYNVQWSGKVNGKPE